MYIYNLNKWLLIFVSFLVWVGILIVNVATYYLTNLDSYTGERIDNSVRLIIGVGSTLFFGMFILFVLFNVKNTIDLNQLIKKKNRDDSARLIVEIYTFIQYLGDVTISMPNCDHEINQIESDVNA